MTSTGTGRQTPEKKHRVGILGAGMISTVPYGYLPGLRLISDRVEVAAIADLVRPRAEAVADDWDIPRVRDDLTDMLQDDGLEAVLNLMPSAAHYENSMKILEAGKHLVTDKPLATSLSEAKNAICDFAQERG